MPLLSIKNVRQVSVHPSLSIPHDAQFQLPDKVLQFGTGVLLRGLPDYFIEKANQKGVFNGRIVVVKSTDTGDVSSFQEQDNLYTLSIRGIKNGQNIDEDIICSAISKILHANTQWSDVLNYAANPSIQIIISNTTESGLQYVEEKLTREPSISFPGKLTQCLYHRYVKLGHAPESKIVVLPTELLTDNGIILKKIIEKLIHFNDYPKSFGYWINEKVIFSNTLVDRIVPGKLSNEAQQILFEKYGYTDPNAIMCEPYALWAIEGGQEVHDLLTFSSANDEIKIVPDISQFKELKLRILNGSHTLLCAKAIAEGFETVYQAMCDPIFRNYSEELIFEEILPSLPKDIKKEDKLSFAKDVIDRFSNPNIEHKWTSIAVQYPMKLTIRVLPLLKSYKQTTGDSPRKMVECIKEVLYFLLNNEDTQMDDISKAAISKINLSSSSTEEKVKLLQKEESIWGEDFYVL
ncbi:MAG: tagaturonate reductase [Saprospiraceae bacterium]|nr:tagaturonate reductase [Saprospiraceae bacterium]